LSTVGNGSGLTINGGIGRLIRYQSSDAREELFLAYPILAGPLSLLNGRLMAKAPKMPGALSLTIHPASFTGHKLNAISDGELFS
jgi:hypothetical protein